MGRLGFLNPINWLLNIVLVGTIVFLLFPLLIVFPASFSPGTVLSFPPDGLSWRWYQDFFADDRWVDAAALSLRLASATAVSATLVGLLAAIALTRFVKTGKTFIRSLVLSPLIVPLIITSVGIYYVMNEFGLTSSFWGMWIGHTVLALPFAVIIIESALRNYDVALEEAAMSLGASRITAFWKITFRIVLPSILAAGVAAFITSWDEVLLVIFLGGPNAQTLPLRMFEFLSTQVRPTIAAISSMLITTLFGIILIYQLLRLQSERTRAVNAVARDPLKTVGPYLYIPGAALVVVAAFLAWMSMGDQTLRGIEGSSGRMVIEQVGWQVSLETAWVTLALGVAVLLAGAARVTGLLVGRGPLRAVIILSGLAITVLSLRVLGINIAGAEGIRVESGLLLTLIGGGMILFGSLLDGGEDKHVEREAALDPGYAPA